MHKLKIVHRDIKPENIMLSPSFRKPVFIDFGLSTIIKEEIGTKTYTDFVGSIKFASEEMIKSYEKKAKMNIDLYYNDLHGLQSSNTCFIKDSFYFQKSWDCGFTNEQ